MISRLILAAAIALPLAGCISENDGFGDLYHHNVTAQLAGGSAGRPIEGGSAERGVVMVTKYSKGESGLATPAASLPSAIALIGQSAATPK